jgi:hypothetical protein
VPDELDAAASAISRIRASLAQDRIVREEPAADAELLSLLASIARLGTGGQAARVSLTRLADWNGFEPYDGERLLDEMFALAQTLARVPKADATADSGTRTALIALRDAVNGLLDGG